MSSQRQDFMTAVDPLESLLIANTAQLYFHGIDDDISINKSSNPTFETLTGSQKLGLGNLGITRVHTHYSCS